MVPDDASLPVEPEPPSAGDPFAGPHGRRVSDSDAFETLAAPDDPSATATGAAEPAQAEPAQAEPAQAEPAQAESAQAESARGAGSEVARAWRRATARLQSTGRLRPERLRAAPGVRRVDRYELRGPLGQGGCGTVYRAWDPKHEREVALKLVHRADAQARVRFEREVKATARLRHVGVVSLLDSGEEAGQMFIVTELVAGGSLAARLDEVGRLPAEEAARVVQDVALAIHYAHGEGILHRDLKPHNVLLELNGQARVVDFGLARLEDKARVTASGAALGTPAYMPPEQVDPREVELDARSDVYSLGATLYHALTGRPPFEADSIQELLLSVLEADVEPPSTHDRRVPADLDTICLKCLEKDPARRYPGAAALARDLERFLRNEPVQARRSTSLERAWRWSRRNPIVATLSLLLILVTASLVAVAARYVELRRQVHAGPR